MKTKVTIIIVMLLLCVVGQAFSYEVPNSFNKKSLITNHHKRIIVYSKGSSLYYVEAWKIDERLKLLDKGFKEIKTNCCEDK